MELDAGIEKPDQIPEYAEPLAMFHREFRAELTALVQSLALPKEARILDVGCGDGFYSALLATAHPRSKVVGLDANRSMLAKARRDFGDRPAVSFAEARLEDLAAYHDRYDLVWCAQSLFSFVEEKRALEKMIACVRPGGMLAVLENDYLHQMLLPWPARVELELRRAEMATLHDESEKASRYYLGRRLPRLLAEAGAAQVAFKTQAIDRAAPLSPALKTFVENYLQQLRERSAPHLPIGERERIEPLLDPESVTYLPRQPMFTLTWLNNFACGRRPGGD